ncbi:hypothetical protein [Streptomyces sp. JJ36]|uniref:hypothetical protein n=1 Tax=Streptomyces sp. JJ36 TaxID=2736645 RepID=UPI001F407DFD|nr:hypothetical protein [Streptomyces sp. JJ36]MCF6521966.1 hypothetical protein [Streptomyces sp. JJ36]
MTEQAGTPGEPEAGNPRWSEETRREIQRAMNAVVREAADIAARRGEHGVWLPPGETAELGDNPALCTAARIWVLDRLEDRIREARQVIERVEHDCRVRSGTEPASPSPGSAG